MAVFIVSAIFIAVVAVFIFRYEGTKKGRKKISGRGGDFEA